jgi:hypothetical protein
MDEDDGIWKDFCGLGLVFVFFGFIIILVGILLHLG